MIHFAKSKVEFEIEIIKLNGKFMKNHKQLLMDFYLKLLSIPKDDVFRLSHQTLYVHVLCALAVELDTDAVVLAQIFERMASEDVL